MGDTDRRPGEPGPVTGTVVVLVLMAPGLVPQVARWVRTLPAPATAPAVAHDGAVIYSWDARAAQLRFLSRG